MSQWFSRLQTSVRCLALIAIPVCAGAEDYAHLFNRPDDAAKVQSVPSVGVDSQVAQSADAAFGDTAQLDGYWNGLHNLPTGAAPHLRGAREVAIYAELSPSVVLVLSGNSLGSGTLVDQNGLIVTNYHVVEGSRDVGVIFKPVVEGERPTKGQVIAGTVIRVDQVSDLALIRVQEVPGQARPARFGSISSLQVGDDVHAIGHPTGEAWTYTRGIVSQIRRNYEWHAEDNLSHRADVIQTQTPINPGNSGGPLINNDGVIVGVNSFKGEGEGLNFAVSGDAVQSLLTAKDDRTTQVTSTSRNRAKCEPKAIKTWRVSDPPGTESFVDIDCDGKGDMYVRMPDDASQPMLLLFDSKHTGRIDVVMVCPKRDGYPEYALYDTTGSGKPSMVGYFHNHEFKPYKVEPYSG